MENTTQYRLCSGSLVPFSPLSICVVSPHVSGRSCGLVPPATLPAIGLSVRSLINKVDTTLLLHTVIFACQADQDILVLTESWLKKNVSGTDIG